ncbi:hypothetical protein, partial [Escherichia albertii]|uniref:hypothetical protein n=1 Tax=Escherichia albertii TaxID=208962 RepID=UPI001F34FCB8
SGEKRVFLVILFTSFSGSLVSRIPGAVQCSLARRFLVLFCAFHTSSSYQLLVDGDQIVKERSVRYGAFLLLTNHPGLHMPRAATSWASCLFAVSSGYIMYLKGTLSSIKKPAEAGS